MPDFFLMSEHAVAAAARLRLALDMFSTGAGLAREQMRRIHPDWNERQIDEQIGAWLREQPGAEESEARKTAALIVTRGFSRGRDLVADLEQHLRHSPSQAPPFEA
jgi:hypothetical protein